MPNQWFSGVPPGEEMFGLNKAVLYEAFWLAKKNVIMKWALGPRTTVQLILNGFSRSEDPPFYISI